MSSPTRFNLTGSGKRALLEVISRRAQGPTRGQILLNHVPMSLRLFQDSCGYVTHKTQLLEGLTAEQTLDYAAKLSLSPKASVCLFVHLKKFKVRRNYKASCTRLLFYFFRLHINYFFSIPVVVVVVHRLAARFVQLASGRCWLTWP